MNILDSIMSAGNGAAVRQLASQLGLNEACWAGPWIRTGTVRCSTTSAE
jgi:hypothetical protein